MKKTVKYSLLFLGISILSLGILFLVKPNLWLRITHPLHYEIVSIETSFENTQVNLNFGVVLNSHYIADIILDSIHYDIKMDSVKFSEGKKALDGAFDLNSGDTIYLPLKLELNKIKEIMQNNQEEDSLLLELDFENFLRLPIAGATSFHIPIKKKIPVPNPPKFKVVNVEKKILKLHDAVYDISFEIDNPNHYEINVKSFHGKLNFPELFSGKINNVNGFYVKPYSKTQTTTTIDIDDLELVRDGLKMLFKPNKEWRYSLDLELLVIKEDSTILPFQITSNGTMPLKKKKN